MTGDSLHPIEAWLDDELSGDDAVALEAWLRAEPANIETFVQASLLHRRLRDVLHAEAGCGSENAVQTPVVVTPYSAVRTPHFSLSSLLSLNTPLGNVAFSYGMSAVLVAIGLFIFSLMSASSPSNSVVINNSTDSQIHVTPSTPMPTHEPELVSIAGITGMVDCVWVDENEAPFHNKIKLHDKFALASGLMEITYHTGARVILQGPCTYEVESADGGFLSLGKLTARVESRSRLPSGTLPTDRDAPKSRPAESRPAGGTYFAVRTPTAVVTDLGTEFAIEVNRDKSFQVSVFRGAVETTRDAVGGGKPMRERLAAGEAMQIASADAEPRRTTVAALGAVPPAALDVLVHAARKSSQSTPVPQFEILLTPSGCVASDYGRIWTSDGKLAANVDRQLAFQMVTDGIFGRGENREGPRSSFDTFGGKQSKSVFVGLLYGRRVRIDRIKIFMGQQFTDGGDWLKMPRLFILKNPVDTGSTLPEDDPLNWRPLPMDRAFGPMFDADLHENPGRVIEIRSTGQSEEARTGYGWALGGVKGNGKSGYVSVTELRGYGVEAEKQEIKDSQEVFTREKGGPRK